MSVKSRKYVSNFQKPCFLSTEYLRTEKRMLWKQSLILNTSHGRLAAVLRSAFIFSVAAQGFSEGLGRSKKEKWHKMPNRNFESFLKYSLILQLRIKRDYLGRQPPPPKVTVCLCYTLFINWYLIIDYLLPSIYKTYITQIRKIRYTHVRA